MSNIKQLLTEEQEKTPLDEVFDLSIAQQRLQNQMFDNLFSGNHRGAMIRHHGGTQAQIIKIGDLI